MQRAAFERSRTIRTWCRHLATHSAPALCPCEFQAGRFRKGQRVGGCGNARCFLCHACKLAGEARAQQFRAVLALCEGLVEIAT
jgi:hypothetical protein